MKGNKYYQSTCSVTSLVNNSIFFLIWGVGGRLSPVYICRVGRYLRCPKCAPSFILLWLALQIPCSLVSKLKAVSPPRPDSEIKKRVPVCRVLTVWFSCPNGCAASSSCCDSAFKTVYVSVLKTSLMGLVGTNYLWGLTQKCIAIAVPRTYM